VDGELDHDERERVLAHLATCARCKAEADCQRRLKSFFAEVAPPPPSDGFLTRLQNLPAGGSGPRDDDDSRGPLRHRPVGHEPFGHGVFDAPDSGGSLMDGFGYAGAHGASVFPVHRAGRAEAERTSPWRGKRFAFAAASAVSLAAMALGGALPLGGSPDSPARNNVLPARAAGASTTAEAGRRNGFGGGGLLPQSGTGARVVAAPGTLQSRNVPALPAAAPTVLSARAFVTPAFASPSFPTLAFGAPAFPADAVNSAQPSASAGATGSARTPGTGRGLASGTRPSRPAAALAGTPSPELLAAPSPLSPTR
jgi:hypothetical protein